MKHFNHDLVTLPTGERIDGFYQTPDGTFPSVTSVVGWKKTQFFAQWRKNNPKEARRTVNRGVRLHSLLESYVLNTPDCTKSVDPYTLDLFYQIQSEVDKIDNIRGVESFLWSKTLGLAGRTDCVAEYDGVLSIIDFKGSTRPKQEKDIENYFLQGTAYAIMWEEMTGQKVDQLVILISCDEGEVQVFKKDINQYKDTLKAAIMEWKEHYEFGQHKQA